MDFSVHVLIACPGSPKRLIRPTAQRTTHPFSISAFDSLLLFTFMVAGIVENSEISAAVRLVLLEPRINEFTKSLIKPAVFEFTCRRHGTPGAYFIICNLPCLFRFTAQEDPCEAPILL